MLNLHISRHICKSNKHEIMHICGKTFYKLQYELNRKQRFSKAYKYYHRRTNLCQETEK